MRNPFKVGDWVVYKDEINTPVDNKVFKVYGIYSNTEVSLGLRKYPDVEQDYITQIDKIVKYKEVDNGT